MTENCCKRKYIDVDKALFELRTGYHPQDMNFTKALMIAENLLRDFPAADVAEIRYGEWIDKPTGAYRRWQSWCSACGKHSGIGGIESNRHKPFCPLCGADMRGKNNESRDLR